MKPLIHFVHGKESGPVGRKIAFLSVIAKDSGFDVESLDYISLTDPVERAKKLVDACNVRMPEILVGSSMGGWGAATASASVSVRGLFLMAPAFYMPDYPEHKLGRNIIIEIVHGWHDGVIPFQNSIRFGQENNCTVHLIDDDHRLANRLDLLGEYFSLFLKRVRK